MFIFSQFRKSEALVGLVGFSAPALTRPNQSVSYAGLWGRKCFQAPAGCCQNLVPYNFRTEVPVSFLSINWELHLAPRGQSLCFLRMGCHISESAMVSWIFLMPGISLTSLLAHLLSHSSQRKFSVRGCVIRLGSLR